MTKYPGAIDTNKELPIVVDNVTEVSGESINALIAAVIALEKVIGANPNGSALDLTSRLQNALNDDGTIKAAALAAAGLVTLPITDAQVGATAAIKESKLDLDFGTTSLQTQINSNDIDIANLQDTLSDLILKVSRHVLGIADRHDGYQIDVIGGLPSASTITTVGHALAFLRSTFLDHVNMISLRSHYASSVSYTPNPGGVLTSDNVQGAIGELDANLSVERIKHNDTFHSNGVSKTAYRVFGGQAAVADSAAKLTVVTSSAGIDVIKLGQINSAVIKSLGCKPGGVNASTAYDISFEVENGASVVSLTISDLHLASYYGELNVKALVNYFNEVFCNPTNNFSLTAFESDDGEILIQHNIDRDDCSIKITGGTAVDTLGFSNILNQKIIRVDNNVIAIDGITYNNLKSIASGTITQSATSPILNLNQDVSALNIKPNTFVHIYNHSSSSSSGSFKISAVSSSPGTTITLVAPIAAGAFSYIIYQDCFSIPDGVIAADPKTLDFYINSSRELTAHIRAETTFVQFNQVKLVEVSQDHPGFVGFLKLTNLGGQERGVLLENSAGSQGPITSFMEGFKGYLKVYSYDNSSYIKVLVDDIPPLPPVYPAALQNNITFYGTIAQDDLLFLGTTYYDGASVIQNPVSKRNAGLSGNTSIGTEFIEGLERDILNFHSSGIVRGFEFISSTLLSNKLTINIAGGQAYIAGKYLNITKSILEYQVLASGNYNLYLDEFGKFNLKLDSTPGYYTQNLIERDEYSLIGQLEISLPITVNYTDARFFINNVESRLGFTIDSEEYGSGAFKTLEAANIYAANYPSNIRKTITVYSDILVDNDILLFPNTIMIMQGNATFNSTLTLDTDSRVEIFGNFIAQEVVTLNTRAQLNIKGSTTFSDGFELILNSSSTVSFGNNATLYNITVSGNNVSILGSRGRPTLSFYGTIEGVTGTGISFLKIADLNLQMARINVAVLDLTDSSYLNIQRCTINQISTPTFTFADIGTQNKIGIKLSGTTIAAVVKDCLFARLSEGIYAENVSESVFSECIFEDLGIGISASTIQRTTVSNNAFIRMHLGGIKFLGAANQAVGVIIRSNRFSGLFKATIPNKSAPVPLLTVNLARAILFDNNIITNIENVANLVYLTGNGLVLTGNACNSNQTSAAAIDISQTADTAIVANNTIINHNGKMLNLANCLINSNHIEGGGGGASSVAILGPSTNTGCVMQGNTIVLTGTTDSVSVERSIVVGNDMSAASFSFIGETPYTAVGGYSISNNIIRAYKTAADAVLLDNPNSAQYLNFNNNTLYIRATSRGLFANLGKFNISNNTIIMIDSGTKPTDALQLGNGNLSSKYLVCNNIVESGTNTAIYVKAYNASVTGNSIVNTPAIADIKVESSNNTFVTGNTLSSNIASIVQSPVDQDNVFIFNNKNAIQQHVYSPANSTLVSGWEISPTNYAISSISGATTGKAVLSLVNLPVGGKIEAVKAYATTQTPNSITINLYRRGTSSLGLTLVGTASGTALTYGAIQITGISNHYIDSNNEYVLEIQYSTTVGTVSLGQVVVDIRV